MKKFTLVGSLILAAVLVYKIFFSLKIELRSAIDDYQQYSTSENSKSITFVLQNSQELKSLSSRYCELFPKNAINSVIVEELALLPIDSDTIIKLFLQKSSPLTNQTEYSQNFIVFYKLSRLFPDASQQLYQEVRENSEYKEIMRDAEVWRTAVGKRTDITEEDKENALKHFSFMNCLTAKISLGLIGEDEDFDRSMSIIQDEIVVKNSRQAKKALEEIRAVLKQRD